MFKIGDYVLIEDPKHWLLPGHKVDGRIGEITDVNLKSQWSSEYIVIKLNRISNDLFKGISIHIPFMVNKEDVKIHRIDPNNKLTKLCLNIP